jgi:phosphatidylglycerophosphate synthase
MFDQRLREVKETALGPVAQVLARRVGPLPLSIGGVALSVSAAVAAWRGLVVLSVVAWLTSRMLDGLDGMVARCSGAASDFGAYIDIMLDTVGYTTVPLGVAASQDRLSVWLAAAFLLASFYLNAMSWTYLSALLEKRAMGASVTGEMTSVTMPCGLIEGTETIILFTLFLLFPSAAPVLFAVMAGAVAVTAVQRLVWANRGLR